MATVRLDQIEGTRARETRDGGWEADRIAMVSGVTGSGQAKLVNAVNAIGMPALGDVHPEISNLYLDERAPEPVGHGVVRVRLIYREQDPADDPDYATIEVGSTVSQVETNKNWAGTVMQLSYTYPATYKYDPAWQSESDTVGVTLTKFHPESSITYVRREASSPGTKARQYVGKCNIGPWSLDPGGAAYQWMCTGIVGRSQDGGSSYDVTYTFQYREDYWADFATYNDPRTGRPPADLVEDTGYGYFYLYNTIEFNGLNL